LVRKEDMEKKQPIPGGYRGAVMGTAMVAAIPTVSVHPQISGDIVLYKLHLECKHCGHEWTETTEEAKF
jgi:hypothetical protein